MIIAIVTLDPNEAGRPVVVRGISGASDIELAFAAWVRLGLPSMPTIRDLGQRRFKLSARRDPHEGIVDNRLQAVEIAIREGQ